MFSYLSVYCEVCIPKKYPSAYSKNKIRRHDSCYYCYYDSYLFIHVSPFFHSFMLTDDLLCALKMYVRTFTNIYERLSIIIIIILTTLTLLKNT